MLTKRRQRRERQLPYRRQRFLCTAGEWRFCQKLEEAVGDRFTVMMQVRVGALLRVPAEDWKRWGRRVSQKSFDFVLVERGSSFAAAAVELDDKTHLLPEHRGRDRFLDQACRRADLPLIRFKTARSYDVEKIRKAVLEALPKGCEVRPGATPLPRSAMGGRSAGFGSAWLREDEVNEAGFLACGRRPPRLTPGPPVASASS